MKKFMYSLFYHLRREVCMWLVGLIECPKGIKKNYWAIAVGTLAQIGLAFSAVTLFMLLFISFN